MRTQVPARAETVGSLLTPRRLLEARADAERGACSSEELVALEDSAVLEAIALQERVGLDVITDGEVRRRSWADTRRHLEGLEPGPVGAESYPPRVGRFSPVATARPIVMHRISESPGVRVGEEFPFLRDHAHVRTKYTMAAPSYHRRYWSDELSVAAYPDCEAFLVAVRDWLHRVAVWLVEQGCPYIQLDAPNYGSLCDPEIRALHAARGHDLAKEIQFDAQLDCSVFDDLDVTSALHVCRGNLPGGAWHSSGGYEVIAEQLFPNLDVDVVLLEYDSERAGDFAPLRFIQDGAIAVLGLLTTKNASIEDAAAVRARIGEASRIKVLDELALSTQCGFASAANAPMTEAEQEAKLRLVASVAQDVWH